MELVAVTKVIVSSNGVYGFVHHFDGERALALCQDACKLCGNNKEKVSQKQRISYYVFSSRSAHKYKTIIIYLLFVTLCLVPEPL